VVHLGLARESASRAKAPRARKRVALQISRMPGTKTERKVLEGQITIVLEAQTQNTKAGQTRRMRSLTMEVRPRALGHHSAQKQKASPRERTSLRST
jgi:nitrate reductase NapAB chaperone NapD